MKNKGSREISRQTINQIIKQDGKYNIVMIFIENEFKKCTLNSILLWYLLKINLKIKVNTKFNTVMIFIENKCRECILKSLCFSPYFFYGCNYLTFYLKIIHLPWIWEVMLRNLQILHYTTGKNYSFVRFKSLNFVHITLWNWNNV